MKQIMKNIIWLANIILIAIMLILSPMAIAISSMDISAIQNLLVEEANRQEIEPALALAMAEVESNFNPRALSTVGAKGVMQIMPATAKTVFGIAPEQLYDAKVNIHLGISFIKQLLTRYEQRLDIALSHYNGGSAVQGKFGQLTVIPATQKYVDKVLAVRDKYRAVQFSNLGYPVVEINPKTQHNVNDNVAQIKVDSSLYQKVETLRSLRLHNIMRNTKSKSVKLDRVAYLSENLPTRFSKATVPKATVPKTTFTKITRTKGLNTTIALSEKRKKVLQWETIFN